MYIYRARFLVASMASICNSQSRDINKSINSNVKQ